MSDVNEQEVKGPAETDTGKRQPDGRVPQGRRLKQATATQTKEKQQKEDEAERPSKNRPFLNLVVQKISEAVGAAAIEATAINFLSEERPTVWLNKDKLLEVATLFRNDPELNFDFLNTVHASDMETHFDLYYGFESYEHSNRVTIHVTVERDEPQVDSVTPVWPTANWQEREVYDLFGIVFRGHPNLRRILMPDNWVGYPMRKDYEPYDGEV